MNANSMSEQVEIAGRGIVLPGDFVLPRDPAGIVVFAHGSGSSRHSPRNRRVAEALHERHFATLLFDLLTEREDRIAGARFEIELLTERLVAARRWVSGRRETNGLGLGYFGASTGAAAALGAAAMDPDGVDAVVSRGGRPDLAGSDLELVRAPTLLIVGGDDSEVLELNREALARLTCPKQLAVVPGATHLFEEPGTLERVADLAGDWFQQHLRGGPRAGSARGAPGRSAT